MKRSERCRIKALDQAVMAALLTTVAVLMIGVPLLAWGDGMSGIAVGCVCAGAALLVVAYGTWTESARFSRLADMERSREQKAAVRPRRISELP